MHTVEMLERLKDLAERSGYTVRHEWLGGVGGGACQFAGRKWIFVDLSLAQIAALGSTIALLVPFMGEDPHGPWVYWSSLAFTFIGAAVFSVIRSRRARIPQEAIIGISYAVASAATILAMSKATSEGEHLKDMLVGNILAVSWAEVRSTALLYLAIGIFHYVFRHRFLAISLNHDTAEASGS